MAGLSTGFFSVSEGPFGPLTKMTQNSVWQGANEAQINLYQK